MPFAVSPQLEQDTIVVCDLELSQLRLMDENRFPWLILVPRREEIREIFELSELDQQVLMREITAVSRALSDLTHATKINVGALGNVVSQLHIHIVARFDGDAAWPGPVWGRFPRSPYVAERREIFRDQVANVMGHPRG